jgi:dTMP kinase
METKLSNGVTLVLDRYASSGAAYSAAKGLSLDWCKAPDRGLPKPDLVIFLDVPIEGSSSREGFGDEKYEKVDFQIKVRTTFEELKDDSWIVLID